MRWVPPPEFWLAPAPPFTMSLMSVLAIVSAVSAVLKSVSSRKGPIARDWEAVDCFRNPLMSCRPQHVVVIRRLATATARRTIDNKRVVAQVGRIGRGYVVILGIHAALPGSRDGAVCSRHPIRTIQTHGDTRPGHREANRV